MSKDSQRAIERTNERIAKNEARKLNLNPDTPDLVEVVARPDRRVRALPRRTRHAEPPRQGDGRQPGHGAQGARRDRGGVVTFTARMRMTYTVNVEVEAENEREAIAALVAGEWSDEPQIDELIDWSGPTNVKEAG